MSERNVRSLAEPRHVQVGSGPVTIAWATTAGARLLLLAACLLAVLSAGDGLGDESRTGVGLDSSRFLMNGVYFADLVRDRPFGSLEELLDYTRYYYARYPALSLGHHPALLSGLMVPVFAATGISLSAGRVIVIAFFALGVAFTWGLVRRTHGEWSAAVAAMLVATSTSLVGLGQLVVAEVPAVALLVAAGYFLYRYCESERRSHLVALVLTAALALHAKQLSAFAMPGLALYAWSRLGWRRLVRRDLLLAAAVFALLVAPLVPMTLMLAKANVGFVRDQLPGLQEPHQTMGWFAARQDAIRRALESQFSTPVVLAVVLGLVNGWRRRDRAALLYVLWAGSVLACIVFITGTIEPERLSIYWVPALAALAGTLATRANRGAVGAAVAAFLALAVVYQAWFGLRWPAQTARGYEEAARFVVQQTRAATVLFSGEVDSGLFVFFVRKHDPARTQIVLRADKVFTTSFMQYASVEERISSPDEIYPALRRYGTRYVVIEDRLPQARVLQWVREAVKGSRFREIFRAPLVSNDPRLRNASIAVYEYLEASPPAEDAMVDIKLALIGRQLLIPLRDLLDRRFLH